MKNLFRALFVRPPVKPPFKSSDAPSTLQAGSEAANRQQLVLITMRDLLRRSAIPSHWIECQTLLVTSRSRGTGLYIHLVVHHWDERLMRYAKAFQVELKERIMRFDPKAAAWVHGIAWDFNAMGTCPFPVLPPKSTWTTDKEPLSPHGQALASVASTPAHYPAVLPIDSQVAPSSAMPSEVEQDLTALFAIRDHEIRAAANGVAASRAKATSIKSPDVFEATEPAPLQ